MPVLVTAADTLLGRRLTRRFLAEGGEVRAYAGGNGEVASLRAAGAFLAVGDHDDEGRLEAALAQVHTVVHGVDPLLAAEGEELTRGAETLATAAANAGVRRLLALSLPGASPVADDELRRRLAAAEAAFAAAAIPSVVLRTSLVDSPELRDALASTTHPDDVRSQEVAPVRLEDLVELVVAFDRLRSRATEGHVVFAADGPEVLSVAGYLARVGVDGGPLVGRRYRGAGAHPLLSDALAGPWRNDDPGLPDAWTFTEETPLPVTA